MPSKLALLACIVFVAGVFVAEERRRAPVSIALIWPLLWFLTVSSRPIGVWLAVWGIPLGSGDFGEETTIDGWVYAFLTVMGVRVLATRSIAWARVIRQNAWLLWLFVFMVISVAWSDFPYVSAKRVFKSIGAAVMVLVVLTEPNPVEAVGAVIRRSAYIVIPFSILSIRYFRDIGISWDWTGNAVSWQGVTTSKNTLGQIAMTSAIYFLWERFRASGTHGRTISYLYLGMSLYLLKGSDDAVSVTSLSVFGVAVFALLGLGKRRWGRSSAARACLVSLVLLAVLALLGTFVWHTVAPFPESSVMGSVILALGRDMTLTGRTEIWTDVLQVASTHPLWGTGYGAFWIGRIANIPWTENLTWTLGQAHNGYIDVYLQIGAIGLVLLAIATLNVIDSNLKLFKVSFEYARLRTTLTIVILFVNVTESTLLRGDHNLWFLFLLAGVSLPHAGRERRATASHAPTSYDRPYSPSERGIQGVNLGEAAARDSTRVPKKGPCRELIPWQGVRSRNCE